MQEIQNLARDTRNRAQETLDHAQAARSRTENSTARLREFIQKIKDFLAGIRALLVLSRKKLQHREGGGVYSKVALITFRFYMQGRYRGVDTAITEFGVE